ncbi:MAG TPA: hypothetical protein VFQ53_34565 [Kofleriaceae bacterium]|nr:hypothetical protein [Kofleriaceae bacterium]
MKTEQHGNAAAKPGALLVGADWAIAHGDADGLAHVAEQLESSVDRALARELEDWKQLCARDFDVAAEQWPRLRERIASRLVH